MEHSVTPASILVVDDDKDDLAFLTTVLAEQGYLVRVASSGALALDAARRLSPDLILLDILMPGMNGYAVCAALKGEEGLRSIPVIFLNELGKIADLLKAFELGGVDYIIKPFHTEEVLARIKTHLQLRDTLKRLEKQNVRLQQEIAERKQVAKVLQESEKRLRDLIESSEDIIFMQDLEGRYLYYNGPSKYGITSNEVLGKTPFDLHPYETASRIMARIRQVVTTGTSLISELCVVWQNKELWFSNLTSPVLNEKGEIVAVSTISRNITETKQAESALQESEKKYRTLFETMVQGVFYQGSDGTLLEINPAALNMLGFTRDQCINQTALPPDWNVIHEDGSHFPDEQYPSILSLKTGKPVKDVIAGIYNPQKKDYVWVNTNAIPQFRPGEETPYQVFVTLYDITERKKLETHLKTSLREKELMLQEIHHRMKNNLQIITSLFRLHTEKISDKELINILRELENKTASMALVHEMLYQSENLTQIDMRAYLDDLIYRLSCSYQISERKIRPHLEVGEIHLGLKTAMPCGLLINELVINSFKYAFPGERSGEVYVSLYHREGENPPFELIVRDNGVGLPKDLNLNKTDFLGLSLVRAWVKQLHGQMHIDCTAGTRYQIRFQEI